MRSVLVRAKRPFNIGDRVGRELRSWAGQRHDHPVHTHDFDYKGHTHGASPESPQYEIESSKTGHIAAHKRAALTKLCEVSKHKPKDEDPSRMPD